MLDLLRQVKWGGLDFLVVDLPPGTGDPVITIAKSLPAAEVVMVTTPQLVALRITSYNVCYTKLLRIRRLPASLVASVAGMQRKAYFTAKEGAENASDLGFD